MTARSITAEGLTVSVEPTDAGTRIVWRGQSEGRVMPYELRQFLDAAFQERAPITVHVDELTVVNSQTLDFMIEFFSTFISKAIPITVHYTPNIRFQRLLFTSLWHATKDSSATLRFEPDPGRRYVPPPESV